MATAPILHVGEDICYRIPVMERAGLSVCRAPCSIDGVRSAFDSKGRFSALAFQVDASPIAETVLMVARSFSSPLVLFENPEVEYDPHLFDLVIPTQTRPEMWLRFLRLVIEDSRELHAHSRELRQAAAVVRSDFRSLQTALHKHLVSPIDLDKIWRGETGARESQLGDGETRPKKR